MKRAVPHRLDTFAHPLEAFLLGFTRSTTSRVLDVNGFGVANVLSRTPHDPHVIWSIISLRNPWTIWTCKTVGPFNLNRGQDLSLPSVKPTDAFSASTSSTDVGHMRGINRPVQRALSAVAAPTGPLRVGGQEINSGYQCSDCIWKLQSKHHIVRYGYVKYRLSVLQCGQ